MKIRSICFLLLFLFSSCGGSAGNLARPSTPKASISPPVPAPLSRPMMGIYEYCAPRLGQVCLDHLSQIAQGGFSLVLNYAQLQGSLEQEQAYATYAAHVGLKVIWPFDDPSWLSGRGWQAYPQLAHECSCSADSAFLPWLVGHLKGSVTWGYYVGDETPVEQHAQVLRLSQEIKGADTGGHTLFVTLSAPQLSLYGDVADTLAIDNYPVGNSGQSIAGIGGLARSAQTIADQHHASSGMVLQAHSLSEYPDAYACKDSSGTLSLAICPYPTVEQMREMLRLSEENARPRLVLWYSFFDVAQKADQPALRWQNLIQAIH